MPISPFPPAPSRADPATFADKADAYLSHLESPFAGEANALEANVNAKELAASASATAAAASELAAANTANVSAWVSGTTYAVGVNRYDTTDFLTYRRKVAGAGTTRPGLDSTNWQLISGLGNVSLDGVQTLTNKTHGSGSTWDGNTISIAKGGTGATTAAAAFDAIKQAATFSATGVVQMALPSEAENATGVNKVITSQTLRNALNATGVAPVYACRAWVNFNGTGTVAIRASGNVSSITDNGTGSYRVNFTTAMPDANYSVMATSGTSTLSPRAAGSATANQLTSSCLISTVSFDGSFYDPQDVHVAIFR